MKNKTRIISLLLSAVMVCTAVPVCAPTALAAEGVRTVDSVSHSDLDSKITAYETKLNGISKPSYGMADAYNKYTYALAVQDAANYGSLNDASAFSAASSDLNTATNGIKEWTAKKGNAVPKIGNGSSQPDSSFYSNILYANGSSESNFANALSFTLENKWVFKTYKSGWYIYYPDTTLMYDGGAVKFPVIASAKDLDGDHYPNYIAVGTTDFSLSQDWKGHDNGFCWPSTTSTKSGYSSSNTYNHDNCWHINDGNNYQTMRNFVNYTGTPSNTLTTISGIKFSVKVQFQYTLAWPDDTTDHTTTRAIHIINYKKLIDKVDAKKTLWTSTAKNAKNGSYREGGFAAFMSDLDSANYDPNSRFTSSNGYQACANDIDSICSTLDSPASRTADTHQAAYNALRTAEDQNDGTKGKARDVYAAGNTKWTTDSWSPFKTAMEAVMDKFDEVVNTNAKTFSYTLTSAGTLATDLNTAYAGLAERADYSEVDDDSAADSKYSTVSSAENYTYDSYLAFVTARKTVNDYSATAAATKLNTKKSDVQTALDDAHNALDAAYEALQAPEHDDVYSTFEAIKSVINSSLTDKYNAQAKRAITDALSTLEGKVYHTVTSEEATLLGVPVGTVLKNTDGKSEKTSADTYSADLLTAFNDNDNDNSYNKFTVRFVINKDGAVVKNETSEAVFGTPQVFELGSYYDENAVILWETVTSEGGVQQSTNKSYGGESVAKLINSDITVTATVTSRSSSSDYLYNIYNGNGKLVKSEYHGDSSVTEFPDAVELVSIPFYQFKKWYTKVDETAKTVMVIADYEQLETVTVSAVNGTVTDLEDNAELDNPATVLYDHKAKIEYSGNGSFYAWAVKLGDKYTIVSYNSLYEFYTHTSFSFVPVIKDGNAYKFETANGNVDVTPSLIASSTENTYGKTADEFLAWKLGAKAPFVAVVGAKSISENNQRAFAIVTDGSSVNITRLGVKFTKNGTDPINETNHALSNLLSTGQFSVSLNNATAANARFRVTVNYNYDYTFNGTTSHFDTVDISDMAQVQ